MVEEKKFGIGLLGTPSLVFKETPAQSNNSEGIVIDVVTVHFPTSYNYNQLKMLTYCYAYKIISPNGETL